MFKPTQLKVLFCLVTALLTLAFIAPLALGIARVEPSKFLFTLKPGERTTGAIKVTNIQETETEYTAVIHDWTLDDQDRLVTFPAGERADSLDGLIKFNPRRFKLAPGQSQYVRFTLTTPVNGDWMERRGIIFFEENRPAKTEEAGSTVVIQVGTTVYLSFSETVHSFRTYGLKVETEENIEPTLLLALANEGQAHIRYQVAYRITLADGTLFEENTSGERLILPASRRVVSLPFINRPPAGNYHLAVQIRFTGTKETLSAQVPFTIPD